MDILVRIDYSVKSFISKWLRTDAVCRVRVKDEIADKSSNKKSLKRLHTKAVGKSISQYGNNRVLGAKPPEINKRESKLNRRARTKLAQLRSGFSRIVNDYIKS